ncbi:MAG: IS66 family insertion sequence element accessory protein TnpB [Acidiferrobacterales bacterium]
MITPDQVLLAVTPVDMRWGADRLSLLVQSLSGRSPCDGTAVAFTNRSHSRLKLLLWDGTGVWLASRRLHQGHFHWPKLGDPWCALDARQWRWLTTGVEWARLDARAPAQWCV